MPTNVIEPRAAGTSQKSLAEMQTRNNPTGSDAGQETGPAVPKDKGSAAHSPRMTAGPPAWGEPRREGAVRVPGGTDGRAGSSAPVPGLQPAPPAESPGPPEAAGGLVCGGVGLGWGGRRRLGLLGRRAGRGWRSLEVVEKLHLRVAGRVQRQELHGLLQAPRVALAVVLVQVLGAGGGEGCGETRR